MSNSHPAFTAVKTAMLLHVPFYASLLLDIMDVRVGTFPHVFPTGIDKDGKEVHMATMATDGKNIWIDEKFIEGLPIECAVFGVAHEISHAMWEHMARGKRYMDLGFDGEKFHPMLFNVAADYVINDMLVKAGVGKILRNDKGEPQWLLDPKYTCDMTVEDVYRDLLKTAKQNGGKGQPTAGDGSGQGDVHVFDTSSISPAEMKRAIQTAADTAKACGNLPGALQRFAEQFLETQVSWQELLRTTVVTAASRDTTSWARPHRRRLVSQGVYLARPAAYGCNNIVVAVDTSGSIGSAELNVFFSELNDIIRTCHPESTWVLGVDTRVASELELPGDVDITTDPPKVGGGGGTDFRPPFDWVEDKMMVPDALIYFTDMMGPFPDMAPDYPVIWCSITPNTEGPFGKTIYVKLDPNAA